MIEKLDLEDNISEMQINIWQKLNEVIEVINDRAILDETDHPEVAEACRKAVRTGLHADLKEWLKLRRQYL